jgi:ABC-type sugar transport system substrate-binding protein
MTHKKACVVALSTIAVAVTCAAAAFAGFNVGATVATGQLASVTPPWYIWNAKTCSFTTTTSHPATFSAALHKIPGFTLAYMPEDANDPFDDSLNAATKSAAVSAGLKFYQFNNNYPSATAPLTNVGEANTVHASAAIEANVIPTEYPAIQAALKKDCIPWLNEYDVAGSKNIPVFQTDNLGTGVGMAEAAVPIMKSRGWVANETYIVTCFAPELTTNTAGVYGIDVGYRNTVAKLFPGVHIVSPDLNCTPPGGGNGTIDSARTAMTNWLTAHPNAKYVTGVSHIDSVYSLGMADALQAANYGNRALVVGRGGDSGFIKLIAQGNPIISVDGDPQFTHWGIPIVAMAEAIALGQPVPSLVSPNLVVVTKTNAAQYGG